MRSRTGGMWWGTAIEAPDPSGLAKFYAELLGWHIGHEEPGTAIVAASPQGPFFVFQQADGYRAPVWPPGEGEQRPMMHFDFQVGDLDSAVAEAVALGATPAEFQPQESVRVLSTRPDTPSACAWTRDDRLDRTSPDPQLLTMTRPVLSTSVVDVPGSC
ncbi:VOC family protein [Streptomyces sp. NPDC056949]|uniref:VOC family protein n=1 Tax=Streptomyces sp. NPDC056949 TaxID=3345976 RepID=UPI0036250821